MYGKLDKSFDMSYHAAWLPVNGIVARLITVTTQFAEQDDHYIRMYACRGAITM